MLAKNRIALLLSLLSLFSISFVCEYVLHSRSAMNDRSARTHESESVAEIATASTPLRWPLRDIQPGGRLSIPVKDGARVGPGEVEVRGSIADREKI